MKVAVGCSSPPDRGSGIMAYARDLSAALRSMGVEVHFVSPSPQDSTWLDTLQIRHVSTSQYDNPLERACALLQYMEINKIDGVINNDNALLQSIAPALRCPFISVGHLSKLSIASLACYQSEWSDYVIAIADDMQRIFVNKYGVPFIKCPIVFTGVEDPGCSCDYSQFEPGILRLIFTGGFNRETKGADLLLKAVSRGGPEWENMQLDWFGQVPGDVARRLAGYSYVKLHGRVPREQLLTAMREADVLLLPSRYEGCPMTMIEAMSLGVVPVTSDGVGAMRWIITSGKEGFICHLNRWPEQMLETAAFLRDHPAVLRDMKRRSRETYVAGFRNIEVATRLLDLLSKPTVNRDRPARAIEVLRWHRPLRPDGLKSPLMDRFHYRLGWLRTAGTLILAGSGTTNTV